MIKKSMIAGQTAFITGASSGIGKASAELFASLGVNLVITARRLDRLSNLAEELASRYQIKVIPVQLDVQKNEEVEAVFQRLEKDKVVIDILVNNAGLALSTDKIQDAKVENWETMIDTNLTSSPI
jgi:NADP-dependent 3-hydroxy acid dehydrogenase YdfG